MSADDNSDNRSAEARANGRRLDIDRAKGFAIALVVWGHLASATIVTAPLWFYISIAVIYSFHMPIFMYLSGFVFFLVDGPGRFWQAPAAQIATRANRLLVPFLFFGLLVVVGKYVAGSIGGIADPVNSVSGGIAKVIINTPDNPSASIWYLLVLFVYTIVTPILWKLSGRRIWVILLIGCIGWVVHLPEVYYLHRIAIYFIFFAIGGLCALYRPRITDIFAKYYLAFIAAFAVILACFYDHSLALLICGIACIPAIHGLFLQPFWHSDRLWLTLGRGSMAIYLLNTIVLGVAKMIVAPAVLSQHPPFLTFILPLFALGLIVPILVYRVMNRFPGLRPITRYLD